MNLYFSSTHSQFKESIVDVFNHFDEKGTIIGNKNRNVIKFLTVDGVSFNFKSFKQPHFINRIVYQHFRKSKACRSFEHAELLISNGFKTPQPVGYMERFNFFGLTSSFYVSEQLEGSSTFRTLLDDVTFNDRELLIRDYTRLMYGLYESGILFLDNSSGNFLIKKEESGYGLYLVDLNRMRFYKQITPIQRFKNLSLITNDKEIITLISEEYAKLAGNSPEYYVEQIMHYLRKTELKRKRKRVLKLYKKILFWKKKSI